MTRPDRRQTVKRWRYTEPVRLYLYGIATAALAVLVATGVVAGEDAPLWAALTLAVLSVPTTEIVRASVYSPATVRRRETLGKGSGE